MLLSKNPTIAIIDSGIGGVSILNQLIGKFKCGNYIYYADNLFMPYGNKNKIWLTKRLKIIIDELFIKYKVDYVIIACNTASTINYDFGYKNVIKMIFQREFTYYATALTQKNLTNFTVISDKFLAKQIEKHIFNMEKLSKIILKRVQKLKLYHLDSFVLGCTHYELVKSIFEQYCPKTKIINNSSFIINSIDIEMKNSELNMIVLTSKQDQSLKEKVRKLIVLN